MSDVLLVQGDSVHLPLKDERVQCVVTSVPYLWQRSYLDTDSPLKTQELGLEGTVDEYLLNMVMVFREVKRCLRNDGVLWLNCGDKMVDKQLLGLPWKLAFALQGDGWILRSEVVWHKINCLPESVQDRPVRAHEQIFLFSKQAHYFYDIDATREPTIPDSRDHRWETARTGRSFTDHRYDAERGRQQTQAEWVRMSHPAGRACRSVWPIAAEPQPSGSVHSAVFPTALVSRCVRAGSSVTCCPQCRTPYQRQTKRIAVKEYSYQTIGLPGESPGRGRRHGPLGASQYQSTEMFAPTCQCITQALADGCRDPQHMDWLTTPVPSLVLDCFSGSSTTVLTARALGRHGVGVELSWNYLMLSRERLGLEKLDTWLGKKENSRTEDHTDLPLFRDESSCKIK